MESQELYRLDCNWCRYNLAITETLLPWAMEVMGKHAIQVHPNEAAKLPKETPNA